MKTLVIHPEDRSTDFLKYVYQNISGEVEVIRDCPPRKVLEKKMKSADKIIMLGHGTPSGLMNVTYTGDRGYIVDGGFADILKEKENVSIWCNSDSFFRFHGIKGFHTGMIISECSEQLYVLGKVYLNEEEQLNNMIYFAQIVGECINDTPEEMKEYILSEYTDDDAVTEFNRRNIIVL